MNKLIFRFNNKDSHKVPNSKEILGGKGANLAQMAKLGLPVPPGFTISTQVCDYFYKNNKKIPKKVVRQTKKEIAKMAILLVSLLIDLRLDKFGFTIFTYSITICSIFSYCFLRSSADSGLSEISYFLSELTSLKVQCITPLVSYL